MQVIWDSVIVKHCAFMDAIIKTTDYKRFYTSQ